LRKSDGATLYHTRDLARIDYWERTYYPDLMVNVVDVAQKLHFRQLFIAADKLQLTKAKNIHVDFGRMKMPEGGMSTRKGNVILLNEVLDEAEKRAAALVEEKAPGLSAKEKRELARILGIGSVKYQILHQGRIGDYTFSWDVMLSFEGNSAPYLLYTVTRANSVLQNAGISAEDAAGYDLELDDEREVKLAIQLLMFPAALTRARDEFKPSHIANYLYDLAQLFNTFYNALTIVKAESGSAKNSRLKLTAATVTIMSQGLALLGIEVPERM
jgi:arginyl-tRNA synthetase